MDIVRASERLVAAERAAASAPAPRPHSPAVFCFSLAARSLRVAALGARPAAVFAVAPARAHALAPLRVGDTVCLYCNNNNNNNNNSDNSTALRALVMRVNLSDVHLVFDSESAAFDLAAVETAAFAIVPVASEITFVRMESALKSLTAFLTDMPDQKRVAVASPSLVSTLLGSNLPDCAPRFSLQDKNIPTAFFNSLLNDSQRVAVSHCLSADSIALIHGPPGTGKTETVVELVRQLVAQNQRVLLCGPSNISVDTLAARLAPHSSPNGVQMSRIGHPSRVRREEVLSYVLDVRVRSSDEGSIANDVRKEMDACLAKVSKTKRAAERRALYENIKQLRQELRSREKKIVRDVLMSSNVVVSTLSGCASSVMESEVFDAVVIDESSQAIEAESWIAILKAKSRVFLAGDHLQLAPTVKSAKGPKKSTMNSSGIPTSLECTLFDRILALYGDSAKTMLRVQYRMNETIMRFPSDFLYEKKLIAHDSVKNHLLSDLPGVEATDETTSAFTLLDTSLGGYSEHEPDVDPTNKNASATSLQNTGEARLVTAHVSKLLAAGVPATAITVITPYAAQAQLLRRMLAAPEFPADVEVGTVDAFQGGECEAVIVSLVRSNDRGEIGFLADWRRLNVAITRARRHLCVIFDSNMAKVVPSDEEVTGVAFLKGMCGFAEEFGDVVFVE
ncbi:hypothetical protein HDU82_006807 [Entophlyctis luteolus]|nr:hypothetical protein HDU82_006807 [Entophlyctis luteolus]